MINLCKPNESSRNVPNDLPNDLPIHSNHPRLEDRLCGDDRWCFARSLGQGEIASGLDSHGDTEHVMVLFIGLRYLGTEFQCAPWSQDYGSKAFGGKVQRWADVRLDFMVFDGQTAREDGEDRDFCSEGKNSFEDNGVFI